MSFLRSTAFAIAERLEIAGLGERSWSVVISPSWSDSEILEDFRFELEAVTRALTRIVAESPLDLSVLRRELKSNANDTVILNTSSWLETEWAFCDLNRSSFERAGALLFWCSIDGVNKLSLVAPNVRSFVGASFYLLHGPEPNLSEPEKSKRLNSLEEHYGMATEDMLTQAIGGEIRGEPEFIEWLLLAGRPDLIP